MQKFSVGSKRRQNRNLVDHCRGVRAGPWVHICFNIPYGWAHSSFYTAGPEARTSIDIWWKSVKCVRDLSSRVDAIDGPAALDVMLTRGGCPEHCCALCLSRMLQRISHEPPIAKPGPGWGRPPSASVIAYYCFRCETHLVCI